MACRAWQVVSTARRLARVHPRRRCPPVFAATASTCSRTGQVGLVGVHRACTSMTAGLKAELTTFAKPLSEAHLLLRTAPGLSMQLPYINMQRPPRQSAPGVCRQEEQSRSCRRERALCAGVHWLSAADGMSLSINMALA